MAQQQINIVIEELELSGVNADQGDSISQALQLELGRLIKEQGVPARLMSGQALAVAPLEIGSTSDSPTSVGRAAARAMYRGFA